MPETMLWTLDNRAGEAKRPNGILCDPDTVGVYDAIEDDIEGHFGMPEGSHKVRVVETDGLIRRWLENRPDGVIVSLAEGLETQMRRVDNGRMRWLSVDLPAAILFRERFLPPTGRFRHLVLSALDRRWMAAVDRSSGGVIATAWHPGRRPLAVPHTTRPLASLKRHVARFPSFGAKSPAWHWSSFRSVERRSRLEERHQDHNY